MLRAATRPASDPRGGETSRPLRGRLRRALAAASAVGALALLAGCGTTRWSDTSRTATEQLLMSDAIDRAVSQIDFTPLASKTIFLDNRYVAGEVDDRYLYSTLRQHMLASGVVIKDKLDEAEFVVEIRAGALGTNRADVLVGVPATTLPTGGAMTGIPSSIPEISLIKRTAQQGVCKVAVFAYHRDQGYPIWQSGAHQVVSKAKDVWIFGAGPIQRGSIYNGTRFAGDKVQIPLAKPDPGIEPAHVSQNASFNKPAGPIGPASSTTAQSAAPSAGQPAPLPPVDGVQQATHVETSPAPGASPAAAPPAAAFPSAAPASAPPAAGAPTTNTVSPPTIGNGAANNSNSNSGADSGSTPSNAFKTSTTMNNSLGSQQWNNIASSSAPAATAATSANPLAGALGAVDAYKGAKAARTTTTTASVSNFATSAASAASSTTTANTTSSP